MPPLSAARWNTKSGRVSASRRRTSPCSRRLYSEREGAITAPPACSRSGVRLRPTKPLAPVTRTRLPRQKWGSVNSSPCCRSTWIVEDQRAAGPVELERHAPELRERGGHAGLPVGRHEQQQESPAAGPEQLAADRPLAPGALVPRVDPRRADARREGALDRPGRVQQLAEARE